MQPIENPENNRTVEVEPSIEHQVPWRVTAVVTLPGTRLRVSFVDGTVGEVMMEKFLDSPDTSETIFAPLREPTFFAQARVVLGAVQWPNGADLAPDAMYDDIRQHGVWVID